MVCLYLFQILHGIQTITVSQMLLFKDYNRDSLEIITDKQDTDIIIVSTKHDSQYNAMRDGVMRTISCFQFISYLNT